MIAHFDSYGHPASPDYLRHDVAYEAFSLQISGFGFLAMAIERAFWVAMRAVWRTHLL